MTNPVYFFTFTEGPSPSTEKASPEPGDLLTLRGPEGRHAATVMRLGSGEGIDLVDGRGLRAQGTVVDTAADSLQIRVERVFVEQTSPGSITLVQALAKNGRDEQAVEAAVELGVQRVVPWQAERSIVRWKADKAKKGAQKWEDLVRAATKQSRRSYLAAVEPLVASAHLAERFPDSKLVVLHEDAQLGLPALLEKYDDDVDLVLVVGPEGGISERELESFQSAGAQLARLGRHVLRSSNAGPSAIAVANTVLGRW